jgi:hypothetical protein
MSKKLFGLAALCIVILVGGCTLTVTPPPQTTVKVENDLTNLSIDVGGTTTNVDAIDLQGITMGDLYYDYVQGGQTSATKVTNRSGTETIYIDSAYVWTKVLGQSISVGFKVTVQMSAAITPEVANTVVFDQTTASSIIQSLAKRKAR